MKTSKQQNKKETQSSPKVLSGTVVSAKMQNTLVVEIKRLIQHPLYKKRFIKSKKYKVHYNEGEYKEGDKVNIIETKPISKDKRWKIAR